MFDRSKRDSKDDSEDFLSFEPGKAPPAAPEPPPRARGAAVIGPSIRIKGDLSGEEDLVIQGRVEGTIELKQKSLTVGADGKVDANVLAHTIIVEGEVKGDLYGAENVAIRKTGSVVGNIVSPKVGLEEGCRFKGSIDMDRDAVGKAFGKPGSAATGKPELATAKTAAPEAPGSARNDSDATQTARLESGSAG